MGQDGFISLQSEDEWFVILKLTEIYRCGSALFLSPVSINSGFDLTPGSQAGIVMGSVN